MTKTVKFSMFPAIMIIAMFASCDIFTDNPDDPDEPDTEWEANFLSFSFDGIIDEADIDRNARTVTAKAAVVVDLTSIKARFSLSGDATAKVNGVMQESGTTVNDFTKPLTYRVTSGDGKTEKTWTVTVTGGKQNDNSVVKNIPYFNFLENVRLVINHMAPGIYIYQTEKPVLFAKGTDGSWFYIPNLKHGSAYDWVPKWWPGNFIMSDGDKREAFIAAEYEDWGHPQTSPVYYTRCMHVFSTSDEMYQPTTFTGEFAAYASGYPLALNCSGILWLYQETGYGSWEKLPGETICGISTFLYRYSTPHGGPQYDYYIAPNNICLKGPDSYGVELIATYIDLQAGDINYMLRKIANIIGNRCPSTIVDFDNMLIEYW